MDEDAKKRLTEEVEKAAERFKDSTLDYDGEAKLVVLKEVKKRQQFIEKAFEKRIDDIDIVQQQRRNEAMAALRKFIDRYPDHPQHTPDTMFRLAELYYEKTQVDVRGQYKQYEKDKALFDRGKLPEEPESPKKDYSESMKLYAEILRRFDKYRYRDVVLYMRGYCLQEEGEDEKARDAWLDLAQNYPDSEYAAEALLRVGEYWFDYGQWTKAELSYLAAARYKDSKFYAMILYKLAWTHFQKPDFDSAIKGFKKLIAHYDETKGKVGGALSQSATALRSEAIQYLARSLAEDDWDGDGEPDPGRGVARALAYLNDGQKFELEIMEEYAKALYDLHEKTKYEETAQVYQRLIDRDPLNPKNPEYHERLIEAYDVAGDLVMSAKSREDLAKLYGKGSAWYQANMNSPKATGRATRLVEVALRQKALVHNRLAQEAKAEAKRTGDSKKLAESRREYDIAIAAYRDYLAQYPNHREAYQMRYLLAEALYFSGKYLEAAEAYGGVRDVPGKTEYREASAFSAIKAVEQWFEDEVNAKRAPDKLLATEAVDPPEPKGKKKPQTTEVVRLKAEKLPAHIDTWVGHSDKYVAMKLVHKENTNFSVEQAFKIATFYYNFRHMDESRKRFEAIMNAWPTSAEASYAIGAIIHSYEVENDFENIKKWLDYAQQNSIGDPAKRAEFTKKLKLFQLTREFDQAELLFKEKKYVEAAKEFERVVGADPKSPVADKALFNAAVAYQNAKYWNSAAKVFERIVTEPRFKGSKFREEALYYLAETSRLFFDFDHAADHYLNLVSQYPNSDKAPGAVYTTAEIYKITGKYLEAARTFERYAKTYDKEPLAAEAFYQIGLMYEKLNDGAQQTRLWKEYIVRFAKDPAAADRIVEANLRLADLLTAKNDPAAKKQYERTIEEFKLRNLQPGSPAAVAAAKAQFAIIDVNFKRYETLMLKGTLAQQGKIMKDKRALLNELESRYIDVFPYKAFDWTIASYYRIGQLYQLFAKMLYKAPDPTGLTDEQMDEYRTRIEDEGLKWDNVAVQKWEETMKQAKSLKIVNSWTLLALQGLNKYKPQEYPLFKAEKRAYELRTDRSAPLTLPVPESDKKPEPEKSPEGETPQPSQPKEPATGELKPTEPKPTEPKSDDDPPVPGDPGGAP